MRSYHSLSAALLLGALGVLPAGCAGGDATPSNESTGTSASPEGQIVVHPEVPAWFARRSGARVFIAGPGGPEGFLYRGTRRPDGTRDGDQMEMIRKLATHGGNALYVITVRSHGGDAWKDNRDRAEVYPDAHHNPWVDAEDPSSGLNEAVLDQWDEWLAEADRNDIVVHFFIYDDAIKVGEKLGWPLDASITVEAR